MAVLVAAAVLVVAPGGKSRQAAAAAPTVATGARIDADEWRQRTDDYLEFATTGLSPSNPMSIIAHAERARRDPSFVWDPTAPTVADFSAAWNKLDNFGDTGDFTINSLLHLYLVAGDQLNAALRDEIVDHLLSFKYWWTEPTPLGITDDQYYWSENHLAIYLADEYIAGQTFPGEVFTNSGMTGTDHMAHARPRLLRWMALRAQFGFSEWFSNTYWLEDFMAMILVAEFSDDPELAAYASGILDIMFVELGSHLQDGWFAPTHGRTKIAKLAEARADSTYDVAELTFDDVSPGYLGVGRVVQLATASNYRPPEVSRSMALDDSTHVVRQRQSIPLDPLAPIVPDPSAPFGLPFDDPMVWWPTGAWLSAPVVPLSVELINTYDLWNTHNFQQASALEPIVNSLSVADLQEVALSLAPAINAGLLSEVDTYTYRSEEVMLSTAQDFRPGQRAGQQNIWQATLGPTTSVFTGHPGEPLPAAPADLAATDTYWVDGAMPKAVQHENVGISIYAPQYASTSGSGIPFLEYEDFTHAYFPQDRFDQVVQSGGWTIGREGDGFVALWSWRPTTWRAAPLFDHSLPFDLLAPGGPDNVWVVEVGRAGEWPGPDPFGAFISAVTSAPIDVVPLDDGQPCPDDNGCLHEFDDGFEVTYGSPTQGAVTSGWDDPLTVDGAVIDVHGGARIDSPWAYVPWTDLCYAFDTGDATLTLDFSPLAPLVTDVDAALAPSTCPTDTTSSAPDTTLPPTVQPVPSATPSPVAPAPSASPTRTPPSFTG